MDCHGFPGPGSDASLSIYTFNPMREFVEGHTDHVDASFNQFVRSDRPILIDAVFNVVTRTFVFSRHDRRYRDNKDMEARKDIFRQNMR